MSTTMITGADGHVGKALAHWLLENSDENLLLLVRATDSDEQSRKLSFLGKLASSSRCRVAFSDLRQEKPFDVVSPAQITNIIHSAAVTSFAVDQKTAREVNIEGTRKLVRFAETCSDLRRFCFVSSLYTAGLRDGVVNEFIDRNEPEFANYYEWSKWQAEQIVANDSSIPWHIYRLATIIGEDSSGRVVQQNVIHNTLRLFYYGLLSIVPGRADTRVYMVSTEFVTSTIGALLTLKLQDGVYHISDSASDALHLGEVIDIVYDAFSKDSRFSRMRILKPLFCDQQAFDSLMSAVDQLGGAASQSLQSLAPFAPQLFSDKYIQTTQLSEVLPEYHAPPSRELLKSVAAQLALTRWGLRPTEELS